MHPLSVTRTVVFALALLAAAAPVPRAIPVPSAGPERVLPNENRHAAGRLSGGVLTLALEARTGLWVPEGPTGPHLTVAAFAEAGDSLQTPGPLIRVPVGTEVRAT